MSDLDVPATGGATRAPDATWPSVDSPDQPAHVPPHLTLALVVIAAAQLMIVLDATIVNVALPHIQRALGFSGAGLEWIVTAYSLAFGSLLLLGGRLGDIYGRRRVFITGIAIFAAASFAGGFATTEWWLLIARAVQGAGAALAAPTALALIATTFPMGAPRNRALGVWAGMAGAGGAIGLLLGGILTTYVSWRWVLFVNVPIGLTVISLAPIALVKTPRLPRRLDIPGVITSTAGLALLVYGLTHAAAGQDGVSHWRAPVTVGALAAAAVLLIAFVFIELHVKEPELPLHLLNSRRRSGAYLMMLVVGMAMFAVFFFLTIYVQTVWGYSAVRAGLAWLPFPITLIALNVFVARYLVTRVGVRPLLLAGPLLAGTGFLLLSRLSPTGTYLADLFLPMEILAAGMGLMFVPITLMVVSHVRNDEAGSASSLLNIGQQIGGSIGLAAIGTIAWTTVASTIRHSLAVASAAGGAAAAGGSGAAAAGGSGTAQAAAQLPPAILYHGLTVGFSRGLLIAGVVMLSAFVIALVATATPEARWRPVSSRHDREQPCDDVLGTCEPEIALEGEG
jgi:EmrB/QacA subfamily drug resistance transporter